MGFYRAKPVVIEAHQFVPHAYPWPWGMHPWPNESGFAPTDESFGYIETPGGPLHVRAGDWIITGIQGEQSLCKPDIFEATYEPVEDHTA